MARVGPLSKVDRSSKARFHAMGLKKPPGGGCLYVSI
jgi:hypothetical protein